jgi:predicted nucleotidyltransferase
MEPEGDGTASPLARSAGPSSVFTDADALHLAYLRLIDEDRLHDAAARAGLDVATIQRRALQFGVRLVILCGSFAKGTAGPDSDVDIVYEPGPEGRGDFSVESAAGIAVDMHSFDQLGPNSRADVLLTGAPIYEAKPGLFWSARAGAIAYMLEARKAAHGVGVAR